jgi:hypothetical protein
MSTEDIFDSLDLAPSVPPYSVATKGNAFTCHTDKKNTKRDENEAGLLGGGGGGFSLKDTKKIFFLWSSFL